MMLFLYIIQILQLFVPFTLSKSTLRFTISSSNSNNNPTEPELCTNANKGSCSCGFSPVQTYVFWPGNFQRCIHTYVPDRNEPVPVIISINGYGNGNLFPGSGKVASAEYYGFALFSLGSTQSDGAGNFGLEFPNDGVINPSNPTPCEDSREYNYIKGVLDLISSMSDDLDPSRVFVEGFSQSSMFAAYTSVCFADRIAGLWQGGSGLAKTYHTPITPGLQGQCSLSDFLDQGNNCCNNNFCNDCTWWPIYPRTCGNKLIDCIATYTNDNIACGSDWYMYNAMVDEGNDARMISFEPNTGGHEGGHRDPENRYAWVVGCLGIVESCSSTCEASFMSCIGVSGPDADEFLRCEDELKAGNLNGCVLGCAPTLTMLKDGSESPGVINLSEGKFGTQSGLVITSDEPNCAKAFGSFDETFDNRCNPPNGSGPEEGTIESCPESDDGDDSSQPPSFVSSDSPSSMPLATNNPTEPELCTNDNKGLCNCGFNPVQTYVFWPGNFQRCIHTYVPDRNEPVPVIISINGYSNGNLFPGSGKVASADYYGFALFSLGSTQSDGAGNFGLEFPNDGVINPSNPTPCEDSREYNYIKGVLDLISSLSDDLDPSRVFVEGFSQSSMFAAYTSVCFADRIAGLWQGGSGLAKTYHTPITPGLQGQCSLSDFLDQGNNCCNNNFCNDCTWWPIYPRTCGNKLIDCIATYTNDNIACGSDWYMYNAMVDEGNDARMISFEPNTGGHEGGHRDPENRYAWVVGCLGIVESCSSTCEASFMSCIGVSGPDADEFLRCEDELKAGNLNGCVLGCAPTLTMLKDGSESPGVINLSEGKFGTQSGLVITSDEPDCAKPFGSFDETFDNRCNPPNGSGPEEGTLESCPESDDGDDSSQPPSFVSSNVPTIMPSSDPTVKPTVRPTPPLVVCSERKMLKLIIDLFSNDSVVRLRNFSP